MEKLSSSFFAWLIGRRNSPAMNNQGLAAAGGLSKLGYLGIALLIATILLGFSPPVVGQAVNATLLGTVTDSSGAAMAAAKVEIKEVNTGISRIAETNDSGNYVFSDLAPGRYQVVAGKDGFKRVIHDAVDVLVNTTVRVDLKLDPGTINETVEVRSETPILQTDSVETGRQIETRQVEDLPLSFNRNFQSLLNLVPGTTRAHREHSAFFNAQESLRTEVNGQSGLANNLQFEGLNDNERTGLLSIYLPPIEAIQTVDVTTSSYDAELGRANGAVTNVILKSGANEFHGAAYEINRISKLAAVPFFQNTAVTPKLPSVYNYYGANVGGPIRKNKTFFFGDFLRINDHQGQFNQATVPPAAFRNGDFSGATVKIYDPATGTATGTGRTQFVASSNPSDPKFNPACTNAAGCLNMIPVARISPIAKAILAKIPLPNVPGKGLTSTNNFQGPTKFIKDTTSFDVKIDHNISQSNRLSGRFSFSDQTLSQSPLFGLVGGPSNGAFSGTGKQRFWDTAVNYYRVFSPTLLMEIRAGVDHYRNVANNTDRGQTAKAEIGVDIPGANLGDLNTSGMPCIILLGNNGDNCLAGYSASLPWIRGETNLNIANNWTKVRGNHTFKWGVDYHRLRDDLAQWQDQNPRGRFRFNNNVTSLKAASPTATNDQTNPVAAFLLDVPNDAGRDVPLNAKAFRGNELFAYAADKWQVSQKLTLDLGLRWEFYPPFTPRRAGAFSNFDPATKNLIIAGVGGNPPDVGRATNYHDFAPRIGIAYRLTEKTVVRGGFALSYFPYPDNDYAFNFPVLQNNAFPDNGSGFGQSQVSGGGFISMAGGFPAPIVASIPANGIIPVTGTVGTTNLLNQNYTAVSLNFRESYTESWNLAVQRSLPGKLVLEAAYVGNHGVDIPTVYNLNAARVAGSGNAGRPLTPLTGTVAQKFMGTSSNYHALQAKLDRKLSGGLLITTAYSYSKAMGYATDGENTSNSTVGGLAFYIGDIRRNYSPLYFNRTHTFVQSVILESPFGKGKRLLTSGVGSKLLGGWEVSTILTAMTGLPLQITGGSNLGAPGNTGVPDLIGPIKLLHGIGSSPWFDVTQGVNPADGLRCLGPVCQAPDCPGPTCRVGNIARRVFSGPGLFDLDASVFRRFPMTERVGLEFRAEAFSVTNTPHFDRPGTNFDSSSFGTVTGTRGGLDGGNRAIQLGAKLTF
jgi:Carboxypeptidase regulatory-like domain/TonB dependent receptor